jgi:hypothetical protein
MYRGSRFFFVPVRPTADRRSQIRSAFDNRDAPNCGQDEVGARIVQSSIAKNRWRQILHTGDPMPRARAVSASYSLGAFYSAH